MGRRYYPHYPGSSPLARGTQRRRSGEWKHGGLIPARAGNTANLAHPQSRKRAHPRSRGEHAANTNGAKAGPGSSPLARGTLFCLWVFTDAPGLIPARAGNTYSTPAVLIRRRAHPRSRGEHLADKDGVCYYEGSSPLARGTLEADAQEKKEAGLIPARAGNTPIRANRGLYGGAHPRSRGEHSHAAV